MSTSPQREPRSSPSNGFASTQWSLVLEASAEGGPALDRLCRVYWRPVYVYIRATGVARDEAEDATQEFFADMLRRDWLKLADRERGSFRAFLRSSARFFVISRHRKAQAQKRGNGETALPLETEEAERELARSSAERVDPAALYEQSWANCVLEAALARLSSEQTKSGNGAQFAQLRPFLTCSPAPGDYPRLAKELQLPVGQIAVRVHRLTQRFGEVIRAEVAATVSDQREVEAELRHMLRLVSRQI